MVDSVPDGTVPVNGVSPMTVSLRPVQFNAASLWESPCFWMLAGAGMTLIALYIFTKKRG